MTVTSRTPPEKLAAYRARILEQLAKASAWMMASTLAKRGNMHWRSGLKLVSQLEAEGLIVARHSGKGVQYCLAERATTIGEGQPDRSYFSEALQKRMAANRKARAERVALQLQRCDRWVTVPDIRASCAISDKCAVQALDDLVADGRALAQTMRTGKRAQTGAAIITKCYATPEAAKKHDPEDAIRAKYSRSGEPLVDVMRKEPAPMMKAKKFTSPKLTKKENELSGPEMEQLKLFAARARSGEAMDTADIGWCMLIGGRVQKIDGAPMVAVDLGKELVKKAEKMKSERAEL